MLESAVRSGYCGIGSAGASGIAAGTLDRLFLQTLHAHGRSFDAAQCEGGATDAYRERIAAEPHARDDFAARAGDEAEITKSREQCLALACIAGRRRGRIEALDASEVAALQVCQRDGRFRGRNC